MTEFDNSKRITSDQLLDELAVVDDLLIVQDSSCSKVSARTGLEQNYRESAYLGA